MYVISLASDGIVAIDTGQVTPGFDILLTGWLGIFGGVVAWYANPLLILGAACLLKVPNLSRLLITIGFFIALSALGVNRMALNESGTEQLVKFGAGYYLWLGSFVFAYLAAMLQTAPD